MEQETKVMENRVRRWAKRLGYRLEKSRARMIHINNRGLYQLINDQNIVVAGANFDAELLDIERYLKDAEDKLRA